MICDFFNFVIFWVSVLSCLGISDKYFYIFEVFSYHFPFQAKLRPFSEWLNVVFELSDTQPFRRTHVYLNKLFTARLGFRQKSSNPLLQILSHYLNNGLPLIKTIKKYKIILFMNYQFSLFIHFVYHFRCFIFGTFTSLEIITNNLKTIPHAYSQNSLR